MTTPDAPETTITVEPGSITPDGLSAAVITTVTVDPPELPAMTDIPTEDTPQAAATTLEIAETLLSRVERWAPYVRAAGDFEQAGEVRRSVSSIADLITKRALSKAAVVHAQAASRIAERVLGQTLRAAQEAGKIRKRGDSRSSLPGAQDYAGSAGWAKANRLADVDEELFSAALLLCRTRGNASFDALVAALGDSGASEGEQKVRADLERYAAQGLTSLQIAEKMSRTRENVRQTARRLGIEIPGDAATRRAKPIYVERVLGEAVSTLAGVADSLKLVPAEAVDELSPEQAEDLSRDLWSALVPIMHLRKKVNDRGGK